MKHAENRVETRFPGRQPTHPGELLREDVLPALKIQRGAFAEYLGVSRQMLHSILTEKADVSPEMAVRLGKVLGNGPLVWLRMQEAVDLWKAQQKLADQIDKMPTLVAA
jgi:addiction module HigA family antidote